MRETLKINGMESFAYHEPKKTTPDNVVVVVDVADQNGEKEWCGIRIDGM